MGYPSIKTLRERLDLDPKTARLARAILDGSIHGTTLEPVKEWYSRLYNRPFQYETKMQALNVLLGGYGVEGVPDPDSFHNPGLVYVNMGDTYVTTICYWHQNFYVASWGDMVESLERRGYHFQ